MNGIGAKRPAASRGLFYTRDSGGEHETTPGEYVHWGQRRAAQLGVTFTGTPEQIEAMIREGRFEDGDVCFDYSVKGSQLQRPGLDALFRIALTDPGVSHIFIPRRDRFARPNDPLDAMKMEATLREAGLTLTVMDKTLPPLPRGQRVALAQAGFSTGGRPPFGFRRWLVQTDGTSVRQLNEGEYVKMAGHHVVWLPGPDKEFALIRRILEMLKEMPACRVAATLTAEGVPPPDAGRLRTDRGVRHLTSGVWHQPTIVNIARNPLLQAVVEYGRRSMGDKLRFSPEGPRELEDSDHGSDGKPRVVANPESSRVKAPARFDQLVEPERHQQLLEKLDERAGTQRGKPRSQDPSRNPLGSRIFDMGCGWPIYRQPYRSEFRYLCGLYQQSHGAACKHNHVDGLIATRFLLGCVRQRLLAPALREKLERKLRAIAERERARTLPVAALTAKQTALAAVRAKRERAGENLGYAEGPEQFRAVAAVFEQLRRQEGALDAEVAAALAGLDCMAKLADHPQDLGGIGQLFRQINARLFLRFVEARLKKRTVNRLASGVVTFGTTPPPVTLYEGANGTPLHKRPDDSRRGRRTLFPRITRSSG